MRLLLLKIEISGKDQSRLQFTGLVAAEGEVLSFLQQTQELDLRRPAELADFIEKEDAARRFFDHPLARFLGAGVGAAQMAEEGIGKDLIIEAGGIDRHQRSLGTTELVNRLGDQLLTGAAFAGDQDRLGADGDGVDITEDRFHLWTDRVKSTKGFPAQLAALQQELLQALILPLQLSLFEEAAHAGEKPFFFIGFDKVINSAELGAADGNIDLIAPGEHDDR